MKTMLSLIGTALASLALSGCGTDVDAPVPARETVADAAPTAAEQPAPPSETVAAASTTRWRCGEILLTAVYGDDKVDLSFSGRDLQLPIARSASGARYADALGNELWSKGEQAELTLAGQEKRECTVTEHTSPWEDAERRGAVFRAIGQEPGWWVEVGSGDSPPLRAELDYGQRKIDIARTQGISSTPGFGGETADGTDVVLRTRSEACSDAMSGEPFEYSATLTVGDKTYEGCGAYLND